jgi:hypothetical protein
MTPDANAMNDGETPETFLARAAKLKAIHGNGNGAGMPLAVQSAMWTTPQAHDVTARGSGQQPCSKAGNACLARDASMWPTARAEDAESSGMRHSRGVADTLTAATGLWATPRTITGGGESAERKRELGRDESGGGDLQAQTSAWPTPCANDHKGSAADGQRRGQLDEAAEQLWQTPQTMGGGSTSRSGDRIDEPLISGQALMTSRSCLPAPATSTPGDASSSDAPTSRPRLNPAFVEWLMGWPEGWTDFAPAATAYTRWRRRMRSYLCGLVCAVETEGTR